MLYIAPVWCFGCLLWLAACCWYFCRVVCRLFGYLWFAVVFVGGCVFCVVACRDVGVMALSVSGCLLLIYICFVSWLIFRCLLISGGWWVCLLRVLFAWC